MTSESKTQSTCWFVGASYGRTRDQTPRFIAEGIWENGYDDKYIDLVKSMRPGDRIAIKAAYTRKKDVGFDPRGNSVSVMGIKAIGTILENPGDGKRVKVEWKVVEPLREWYFYTYQRTVWKIVPGASWHNDALIAFTFENEAQDIDRFRNDSYWRQRFGDIAAADKKFAWTVFYEAVANALLTYKADRKKLVQELNVFASQVSFMAYLHDVNEQGEIVPISDICPFTVMGIFNRGITTENRMEAMRRLASILGVTEPVPESFDGIPVLNNLMSMFFAYAGQRKPEDIDILWTIFDEAIKLADEKGEDADSRSAFLDAYDNATQVDCVGWNLTMGLYWIRPWFYPTLDSRSKAYITLKLGLTISLKGKNDRPSAGEYVALMDTLTARFLEDSYPAHTFPELSLAAWQYRSPTSGEAVAPKKAQEEDDIEDEGEDSGIGISEPPEPYTIDSIIADGCFLPIDRLKFILESLRLKQNLILQGPPGTGKTWLAKRLGYSLIGAKDESKLRAVQFHPNMSYEDFIRGYRPNGQGRLDLVDGPFMQLIDAASKSAEDTFVLVIEEINRGNPAQIFGEMLTLIEADKRTPDEGLELCYRRFTGERVSVPKNLFIIGTMNIADRSLALVDLALRRRFAFIELEPCFNEQWRRWVLDKIPISPAQLDDMTRRINELNATIEGDPNLKRQFRIGHSFLTPSSKNDIKEAMAWYHQVVETQIGPLLEEYWFDRLDTARKAKEKLLEGL
jgi:5-methylcytosine-specific restriction protein B